jgi:hypothetical protein
MFQVLIYHVLYLVSLIEFGHNSLIGVSRSLVLTGKGLLYLDLLICASPVLHVL